MRTHTAWPTVRSSLSLAVGPPASAPSIDSSLPMLCPTAPWASAAAAAAGTGAPGELEPRAMPTSLMARDQQTRRRAGRAEKLKCGARSAASRECEMAAAPQSSVKVRAYGTDIATPLLFTLALSIDLWIDEALRPLDQSSSSRSPWLCVVCMTRVVTACRSAHLFDVAHRENRAGRGRLQRHRRGTRLQGALILHRHLGLRVAMSVAGFLISITCGYRS